MKNVQLIHASVVLLASTILSTSVSAQSGNVTIHKDNRIDQRISAYGEVVPPNPTPQIDGYRIQLAFEQSKTEIERLRDNFKTLFPDVDTYINYKAPNFFLKAGDFRTKLEAEKIKAQVEKDFPTSNVIRDNINLPKIPN